MKRYARLEVDAIEREDSVMYSYVSGHSDERRISYFDANGKRRWKWGRDYMMGYDIVPCSWLKPCNLCGKHVSPHRLRNEYLSDYPYDRNGRWHLHLTGLCMSCWNKARGIERRMRACTEVAQMCRWLLSGNLHKLIKEYQDEQTSPGSSSPAGTPYMRRFENIFGADCRRGGA